ncbi:MAG: hypothetical protein GY827_09030 [Cytophagales bacterium]|nr:hypothetical protein [Cytophagales bacterium]
MMKSSEVIESKFIVSFLKEKQTEKRERSIAFFKKLKEENNKKNVEK